MNEKDSGKWQRAKGVMPRIKELVHEADGRLKFWKMITPRRTSEEAENKVYRSTLKGEVICSVNEKGELVDLPLLLSPIRMKALPSSLRRYIQ